MTLALSLLAGSFDGLMAASFLAYAMNRRGYTKVERGRWALRTLTLMLVMFEIIGIGLCQLANDPEFSTLSLATFSVSFLVVLIATSQLIGRALPSKPCGEPDESHPDLQDAPWIVRHDTVLAVGIVVAYPALLLAMGLIASVFC